MDEARLLTVLERLSVHQRNPENSIGAALCATCVEVADVSGAGITLHTGLTDAHLAVASTDQIMAELEELERTLGEGPCVDAYRTGTIIAEPDLANPATVRWIGFTREALRAGARAAFGYPLRLATARFGALNLYATAPGLLTDEQHENALTVATVAAHVMVTAEVAGPLVTAEVAGPTDDLLEELLDVDVNQLTIHQAAGMVSVQLSCSIAEALVRLRARAFADGRPLSAVAADVVARRIRLAP